MITNRLHTYYKPVIQTRLETYGKSQGNAKQRDTNMFQTILQTRHAHVPYIPQTYFIKVTKTSQTYRSQITQSRYATRITSKTTNILDTCCNAYYKQITHILQKQTIMHGFAWATGDNGDLQNRTIK